MAERILSHETKTWKTTYIFFFCQPLGMIIPLSCLLTGPGLYSKQTSPEHNLNAEHLAFSNCWCAAADCCHQKLLVSKLQDVLGPRYLMRLWNYASFFFFITKWEKKMPFARKKNQQRSAKHLSRLERERSLRRRKAFTHMRVCLSDPDLLRGAHTITTCSNNSTRSCLPFCTKLMCKWERGDFDPRARHHTD